MNAPMAPSMVKRMRMALGIRQMDAAMIFGVTKATFCRYETGTLACPAYVATGLLAMCANDGARHAVLAFWGVEDAT